MSDTDRMYRLLTERGHRGVHTLELRTMGYSGNPSQRAADIEAKYGVRIERERERRNGRNGSRYRLVGHRAEGRGQAGNSIPSPANTTPSPVSGKSAAGSNPPRTPAAPPETLFEVSDPPIQYDPWESAA